MARPGAGRVSVGPPLTETTLVGGVGGVGVVGPGVDRGGHVQERGRGQIGVDLPATEQPLGHGQAVAGHLTDAAFLVDQTGPVAHGHRPVLGRAPSGVQAEEGGKRVRQPGFAVVGDRSAQRVGPRQRQLTRQHGVRQGGVTVTEPGDAFEAVGFGLGTVRVGQQPPLRRRGPGRDPCRGRPQRQQIRDQVALGLLHRRRRRRCPVEPVPGHGRSVRAAGVGGGTGHGTNRTKGV